MALSTINSRSIAAGALRDSDLGTLDTLTVSGNATFDTSTLVVDAANNRVGMGTASPASKLHVDGSFRQTGATAPFEWTVNAGATDYYKLNSVGYSDNIIVATAAGNVGIGTSSPGSYKLNVNGQSNFSGNINLTSTSTLLWNGGDAGITNSGTNLVFKTYTGSSLDEAMRITSSGNVGIGTTSPDSPLHLICNEIGTGANKGFKLSNYNETQEYGIRTGVSGTQNSSFSIYDETNSANRLVILSNGNVGIGTTNPVQTFVVSQDGNDNIEIGAGFIQRYNRGTSSYGAMDYYAASHNFWTTGGGQHSLFINSSGDVGIGTSSPNSYAGYGTLTINGTSGGLLDFETAGTFVGEVYADGVNGLGLQAIGGRNIKFSSGSVVHTIMRNNYITSRYTGLGYETINYLRSGGTYTHVKTNIYRGNYMYYIKVVGAGGYAGENTLSLITGYAYAAYLGTTTSNYHGVTNLGNYPITDVYYSSDNYLCFIIQSNAYAQYTVTMSSHATGYNTGQENLIASSVGNSSTARYYA